MQTFVSVVAREIFRRERIPARLRWWFVAEGMIEWYGLLRRELAPHLGGRDAAARVLSDLGRPLFLRRHAVLRERVPALPAPDATGATGLLMGGLYRIASAPDAAWMFDGVGGAPRTFREHVTVERWMAALPLEARWEEVANHLGELLIRMTEDLPGVLPRVRPIVGDVCFAAGVRFGRKIKRAFALPATPDAALETLRMSEYIFRVNPEHWGTTNPRENTGYLEGTACPWYTAPGWNGAHCGIFGQFQSGISSAFGLRYHLTTTIPKHGGHTCRIDVKPIAAPIPLRLHKDATVVAAPGARS